MRNAKTRKDNTSGVKNVYWHKQIRRWSVRLSIKGKQVSLGCYATLDEASAAAERARAGTFGIRKPRPAAGRGRIARRLPHKEKTLNIPLTPKGG
jgi:hypothetical protein